MEKMRNSGDSPPPSSNSRHHPSRTNSNYPHRNSSHPYYQSHQYYGSSGSARQAYRNDFGNDVEENYEEERSKKDLRSRLDELKKSKDKSSSSDEARSKQEELELRASLQSAYYRQSLEMAGSSKISSSHRHSQPKSSDREENSNTKRSKASNEADNRSSSSSHKRSNDSPKLDLKRTKLTSTVTTIASNSSKSKTEEKYRITRMINDAEVSEIVSDEEKSDESDDESKHTKRKRQKSSSQEKDNKDDENLENEDVSINSSASNSQERGDSLANSDRSDVLKKDTRKNKERQKASSNSASRSRTRSNSISDDDRVENQQDDATISRSRSGSSDTHSRNRKQPNESEQSDSNPSEEEDDHKKKRKTKRRKSYSDKSNNSNQTQSEHSETEEENYDASPDARKKTKSKSRNQHHIKNRGGEQDSKKDGRRRDSYSSEESVKHSKEDEIEVSKENDETSKSVIAEPEVIVYHCAIQGCRSVEEFECLNKIEEGAYGVVYRAKDKKTHEIVALKRLKMEKEKEGFPITSIREVDTLLKAQHPNVVTVREIVVGSNMDKIYMVMDYVEHDLKSLMQYGMRKPFLMSEVKTLMQQLLSGIAHLHDNWIIHRDLKTSNLLLSHKGILKIADFGLAREYGSPLKEYTPIVVTLWYRCPELLLNTKKYSTSVDMWSVGCIFGELMTMKALFPGKNEKDQLDKIFKDLGTPTDKIWPGFKELPLANKLQFTQFPYNVLRSRFGNYLSDKGFDLINKLLTYDPTRRLPAEEALKSDFFKESPLPVDAQIFPTWPAKSEGFNKNKIAKDSEPRAPSPGKMYEKLLGDVEDGFVLQPNPIATGFTLR